MERLADTFEGLSDSLQVAARRARVVRTGERQPIPSWIRSAITVRDGYACLWCKSKWRLVLDHIVPWSAGGSDDPTNLRLLCWNCNEGRSNYRGVDIEPRLPLTSQCVECDGPDGELLAFCLICNRRGLTHPAAVRAALDRRGTA